ncbi:MAG TPA: glycosyltransferase [Candidatus Limnocylindrales bacterium]|nr:glycosyltransferase [Candidatus Limnocylindrales bacterium]
MTNPKISIVIPALNEEERLPRCLDSLLNQSFDKKQFEIIVVDGGSADKTVEIARKMGAIVYKTHGLKSIGSVRAYGLKKANGEILAFTDSDSFAAKDWLEEIIKVMSDPKIVCIGGRALPDKYNFYNKVIFTFYNFFHIANHALGKPIMWGFNMAVKKYAYEKIGGINEELMSSEDWDLAFKIKNEYGMNSCKYIKNMKVFTSTRKHDDLSVFLKYAKNGVINYIDLVILGRTKARPAFSVR